MATTHLLITALLLTVKCLAHSDEDADHEECRFKPCEPGFFCYKDTYRCAACIDCASRFRENSSFGCHQKAADCGACLPGYMEPPLEHDVLKESCMPQTTGSMTTSKTSSKSETEYVYDFVVFLTGVSLLSLFLMASFLYRWHKDRRVLPPQEGTELQELMVVQQQPPPPYSPLAFKPPPEAVNPLPSAPVLDSTVQIDSPRNCDTNIYVQAHRVQQLPPARVREQFQQAKASRCPNWVNPRHYQSDSPQSSTPPPSEDSSDGGFGETIHDENTQESHWTPNTSQENVEESASQMESSRQQEQVGSTAVGTIIAPDTRHRRDSRMGRRNSSEDVSSQESQDGPPREKRMRSASPPQQTRHFDFLNNNNINSNQMSFNQFNTSAIQINLNLNRSDIRRDPQELGSPLDSEDGLVELA